MPKPGTWSLIQVGNYLQVFGRVWIRVKARRMLLVDLINFVQDSLKITFLEVLTDSISDICYFILIMNEVLRKLGFVSTVLPIWK